MTALLQAQTSTATATPAFIPTSTPKFSATPSPTATSLPPPCNLATITLVTTAPNDGMLEAGQVFTSTWELENIGSCAWNRDYTLAFADGEAMDGPEKVFLKQVVDVGESVTLTMTFRAPTATGEHRAYYALLTDVGESFVSDIQVAIQVIQKTVIFDGAADPCGLFTWATAAGPLACPSQDAVNGSVIISDTAILVRPNSGPDGLIQGTATITITIQTGDHFQATFGCPPTNIVCNAIFTLGYLAADSSQATLDNWPIQNSDLRMVDVDLSSLAGQETALILSVRPSVEVPEGDYFVWVRPRIVRYE
jgi:hypothetical protein